jgi:D-alanyl-D-alanine carboxypeptidase/D-alanyl-D-alanine-endopeptidase (penicillin-binding protein 4)
MAPAALLGILLLAPPCFAAGSLQTALRQRGFEGAQIGVVVEDAETGRALFQRDADRPLVPASNQKILTAVAAFAAFGPTHQFVTGIYADRPLDGTGAVGTLIVRGGGDPALTSEEWWRLAADLRRIGLRKVTNGVILDASVFDDETWNPTWGSPSARAYHSRVAGLSANYGSFTVEVRPSQQGPLLVAIDPPIPYFTLANKGRSDPRKSALQVDRQTTGSGDQVIVSGTLAASAAPETVYRSVSDPVAYAGSMFRYQLAANGIEVGGETRVGTTPPSAREILAFEGQSLAEISRLFLKHSNNGIAESLIKSLGAHATGGRGSWDSGMRELRSRLTALGVDLSNCTLVDGSGLSRSNRVTARAFASALRAGAASFAFGPELVAGLPIAARDGTLKRRAAGAMDLVRAKTGLLTGVTGLSGYARLRDGTNVVFSILLNDYKHGDVAAMAAVDAFVGALVSSTSADLAR